MQVHYDEGVAIHIDPEPCVGVREDGDEASVGESIGQPLSLPSHTQGGSRMPELGPYGSVRGALGNERPLYVADCLANRQIC